MEKFGKIEKFIESIEVEEVNESAQALLFVNDAFYGGNSGTNDSFFCFNIYLCACSSNSGLCK